MGYKGFLIGYGDTATLLGVLGEDLADLEETEYPLHPAHHLITLEPITDADVDGADRTAVDAVHMDANDRDVHLTDDVDQIVEEGGGVVAGKLQGDAEVGVYMRSPADGDDVIAIGSLKPNSLRT